MNRRNMTNKCMQEKRTRLLRGQQGLTLVEIMTVLVILSVLAMFVVPEVMSRRPRMWLKSASEDIFADMQKAKMHAIKNNVSVSLTFTAPATCPGGSYIFDEIPATATPIASGAMVNEVCLSASSFVAGDGFTSRGLTINGAVRSVTLTHIKVAGVQYQIQQSVAGGVSLDKL